MQFPLANYPREITKEQQATSLELAAYAFEQSRAAKSNLELAGHYSKMTSREFETLQKFYFMNGQCHALALAIQEATLWPLQGAGWQANKAMNEILVPAHVFVLMPSQMGLDACEVFTRSDGAFPHPRGIQDDWQEITKADLQMFQAGLAYPEPSMKLARAYADRLLSLV